MELEFITAAHWNDSLWELIEPMYQEAFPSGAKPAGILHNMLDRGIAYLHAGLSDGQVVAMAVTGIVGGTTDKRLIIDYLAVAKKSRGEGLGSLFLEKIIHWAEQVHNASGIIIEVEAGNTAAHLERIHFWERNGFKLTPYIHQYIWVPEPYQAMLRPLKQGVAVEDNGESLFRYINNFHRKSYRLS
ncbi:GNAT family N-acetyltransferase [Paenibacillus sp. sgz500992]|uniref:GNAT family N-acetyltransferase n=1 Tax=Paenibacillus sp. sgz500992 TaxID=3242476 RepID=UPI0036D3DF88